MSASCSGSTHREGSDFGMASRLAGESIMVGRRAFTVILWLMTSAAKDEVRALRPALLAA